MSLAPRDYRMAARAAQGNIKTFIDMHPDAFECLLFLPVAGSAETTAENDDVVGSLDSSERTPEYGDPVAAKAVRLPSSFAIDLADDGGDLADGETDSPILLLLSVANIPKQTVVQYEEFTDVENENSEVINLYVQSSEAIGAAPMTWKKHYCIPFRAFADAGGNIP